MFVHPVHYVVALVLIIGINTESANAQSNTPTAKPSVNKPAPNQKKAAPQKSEKGPAYTAPPKGDASFPLMGEFVGRIKSEDSALQLGLQIRAIKDNRFEAIAFRGGLPGQPKFNPEPIHMIGQRSSDFVILSGGPWAIFVEKNNCRVVDRTGKEIGKLKRIRRSSPTLFSPAPEGAIVLFDGTNTKQFTTAKMTDSGLLMEGANLKPMFQDFHLHVEFRLPYMPMADSQQRGNSGLYLQSRYECQILDSFATPPVFNGMGAIYRFRAPDLNMAFPPLTWQTYDVSFTAPRWAADGSKLRNATINSWVNGVKVQDNVSVPNKTGAGKTEEPILLPIKIQDHGDPVRFRNAWIVDRGLMDCEFPIHTTKEQRKAANKTIQLARQKRNRAIRKKKADAARKVAQQKADQAKQLQSKAEAAKVAAEKAEQQLEKVMGDGKNGQKK